MKTQGRPLGHELNKFVFVVVVFLTLSLFSGIVTANQAPSAVLSASAITIVEGETVTFDGSASSDPDGYVVSYKYIYGDGTNSGWVSESTHSRSYPNNGTYDAKLRVKDNGSAMSTWSSTVIITVTVNQGPSAVLSASAITIVEGRTMTFDGSASSDPDGSIASYWYDYGNGSDSGWVSESTHSWSSSVAGNYSVKLKVKDNDGAESGWSSSVTITVTAANQGPSAVLSASAITIVEGRTMTFDGSASSDPDGSIASYWYDYGNGSDSGWVSDSTHSFSYSAAGNYSAKLKVKDNDGAESSWSSTIAIIVTAANVAANQAPSAVLSASPTTIVEGETVTFDGSASSDPDGSIASYWYDYGNGSDSGWVSDSTHSFSYSAAGTYSTKLKVKDNDGAESGWSSSTVTITVTVRPSIILLANSIDFSLASDLIEFFNNNDWEVIHATNADFDQYKNQKFIIILGGPDAYEGVGNITQRCLSDSQEEFLRSKGNRKMSVKTNVWSQQGQMVFIIAGSDRHETRSAHLANRGDIINRLP